MRIKASGLKVRFCTNESQATRHKFVGFDISVNEVFSPAPAACKILKDSGLRPHLLVYDEVVTEFANVDKSNLNCVVVGDAADNFSYKNVNEAFRVLIGLEKPALISLGRGRYCKETDGLKLDVGVYMKALACPVSQYACDIEAEVVGKPAKMFFQSALADMDVEPHQAIMIGDDLVNDVGGAQQCRMKALQVRMGKYSQFPKLSKMNMSISNYTAENLQRQYRPSDEKHPTVKADGYVNNLAEAVDRILKHLGE
ncbi:LHPP phosphatase, partial [Polyodon spathula]|nr:LHPP phosphatase [Polyodon spathula]